MESCIYKFNGGLGAVLCNQCRKIIYQGSRIPIEIEDAKFEHRLNEIGPLFCCKECEDKYNKKFNSKKND